MTNLDRLFEFAFTFLPFVLAIVVYIAVVIFTNHSYKKWPTRRIVWWTLGVLSVGFSLVGPVAEQSHHNFTAHMYGHLLLGMLGPLLIACSAPMTLLLRALPVRTGRKVSKWLRSKYVEFISHPITASMLNIGGLYVLYTTDLFGMMHESLILYIVVHLHVFWAGYLFTISLIYTDIVTHRTSFIMRATVLVIAMAGHGILSKWIYAYPPTGIEKTDAELGAMTMYYGGDFIDVIIVIVMCYKYFEKSKRTERVETGTIKLFEQ